MIIAEKKNKFQQFIIKQFPIFANKDNLIDYYVNFQYPDKQKKLIQFWQKVFQFIITLCVKEEQKIFITFGQLKQILQFYNLKPVNIPNILNYLMQIDKIMLDQQQLCNEYKVQKQEKQTFFSSITALFRKRPQKLYKTRDFASFERLYSKKILDDARQTIINQFSNIFTDDTSSINYYTLIQQISNRLNLNTKSVQQILKRVSKNQYFFIQNSKNSKYVIFNRNYNNLKDQKWLNLQRIKYQLRQQIKELSERQIKQKSKSQQLCQNAKNQISSAQSKIKVQNILEQANIAKKKAQKFGIRKRLLEDKLDQLQLNNIDNQTIKSISQAQKIMQLTAIDLKKLKSQQKQQDIMLLN